MQPNRLWMVRTSRAHVLGLTGTLAAAGTLIWLHDVGPVWPAMASLPASVVAGAGCALVAGLLVSSLRHRAGMQALGLRLPFGLAFRANVLGIIGGLLFLQVVGQTLARGAVLARHGVSGAGVVLANLCERLVAMLSLLGLGIGAGLYLYGGLSFDAVGSGASLLKLGLGLVVTGAAVLIATPDARQGIRTLLGLSVVKALAGLLAHSLLVHAATLLAFVLVAHAMAPAIPLASIAAASALVMVAASLPISFAGWGVRELSAVQAFSFIGMSADKALAVALVVGLGSLAAVSLLGLAAALLPVDSEARGAAAERCGAAHDWSHGLGLHLGRWLPAATAALVMFQLHVPTLGGTMVNLNLADPLAVLGGCALVAHYRRCGTGLKLWRTLQVPAWLAAVTVLLAVAFVVGWWRQGFVGWAFYNRLLGWPVVLGYLATGALSVAVLGGAGRRRMLGVLLVSGLAIALMEIGLTSLAVLGGEMGRLLPPGGATGMAQNSNAFALQVLILMAVLPILSQGAGGARVGTWVLAVVSLACALYLTRSRAGVVAGVVAVAAAWAWGWVPRRVAVAGLAAVSVLVVVGLLAMNGLGTWPGEGMAAPLDISRLKLRVVHVSSDSERWQSIAAGLAMWWQAPVFGAGLGAFIGSTTSGTGKALVIHNTGVWILAELGLAGFVIVAMGLLGVWRAAWRDRHHDPAAQTLLLLLLVAAVFSMAHDVFYQRILWLGIGATIATRRIAVSERWGRRPAAGPDALVVQLRGVLPGRAGAHASPLPQRKAS